MKTSHLNLIPRSALRLGLLLIPLGFACFSLLPQARASVCQEGCSGNNTFLGEDALLNNAGFNNTAVGFDALTANTSGLSNTATGAFSLFVNTTGNDNTATGYGALLENIGGMCNTATGEFALGSNSNGLYNTAVGCSALEGNLTGGDNTAIGLNALGVNTTGSSNIAIGSNAGSNLTTGSNNIDIGALGVAGESNTIRIGKSGTQTKTVITGIFGTTVAGGVGVIVGSGGRLGTVASSERFKDVITPMDKASEAILALKPVTFRYKHDLDPDGIPQFGLVAEDVEKVNPDLVARDDQGKPYTVRYEAVNAMLLNEFLKEHRRVEQQQATITQLQQNSTEQRKQIEALTAGLQKMSAQLELSKTAPQTVKNND